MEIAVDPSLEVCSKHLDALSTKSYGSEIVKRLGTDGGAAVEYVSPCPGLVDCGYDRTYGMETHNSFVEAVHTAFAHHYPLRLSPDSLWLCIVQGLALHVDMHSEQLRHHFVNFAGKEKIKVENDCLVRGGKNDWSVVLGQFTSALAERLEPTVVENLVCNFSTTDSVSLAASEVALMDVMSSYFNYECITECGIPKVTLEGTVADWQRVLEKAKAIRQYELDWWIDELQPVLEKLVLAAQGEVDREFWQSFYKLRQMSGGPFINGWILTLFPYLVSQGEKPTANDAMGSWRRADDAYSIPSMVTTEDLPCGMSHAPFVWKYFGTTYKMEFISGFFGVEQDNATLALKPHIGFAVAELK